MHLQTLRKNLPAFELIGFAALGVAAFAATGCGGSSSNFSFPAVAPILNASLPSKLQSSNSTSISSFYAGYAGAVVPAAATEEVLHDRTTTPGNTNSAPAATAISNLFQEYWPGYNGHNIQGLLAAQINNVDGRMASINSQIQGFSKAPSCLSATATAGSVDLSAIDPMLKLTLSSLQCNNAFSGNSNGSGVVFGQNGTNYSLYMALGAMGSGTVSSLGGFMTAANITNYGSTSASAPQTLDGLQIEYAPQGTNNRMSIIRYKAVPSANTFEMFMASNQTDVKGFSGTTSGAGNGASIYLGGGFRVISNGTNVYADGVQYDGSTNFQAFDVCLKASDLSVDTASNCQTLANSFTLNNTKASLNFIEITGTGSVSALPCLASGYNSTTCLQAPASTASTAVPATTSVNAFTSIFPITTFSSVAALGN